MSVIPCKKNDKLRKQIIEFAETLKTEAHLLGNHGLSESESIRAAFSEAQ